MSMNEPLRDKHLVIVSLIALRAADELLLLRRQGTGRMDGYWSPPVGHLEAGESLAAAACRECLEETGVDVPVGSVSPLALMRIDEGLHLAFSASIDAGHGQAEVPPGEYADRVSWHRLNALPQPAVPWLGALLARVANPRTFPHWLQDTSPAKP